MMRRNVLNGLLFLCGLAGAIDLGYHLGRGGVLRNAEGQTAEAEVILTAANTQNEAFCFIFNTKTTQLATYMQRQTGGIELKGIRNCGSDFTKEIEEYPKSQSPTAVRNMKKLAEQLAKDKDKDKDKEK